MIDDDLDDIDLENLTLDEDEDNEDDSENLPITNNGGPMQVTSVNPKPEVTKDVASRWLLRILEAPDMNLALTLPSEIKGYLYIDERPRVIYNGIWQLETDHIYLTGRSSAVDVFTKLSVLAAIAGLTGASTDQAIIDKITQKLITILNESTRSIYASTITSMQRPTRLAIDHQNLHVAAEINGHWLSTSGAPLEVTPSWIIMDF